jgi:hypothetical protein
MGFIPVVVKLVCPRKIQIFYLLAKNHLYRVIDYAVCESDIHDSYLIILHFQPIYSHSVFTLIGINLHQ